MFLFSQKSILKSALARKYQFYIQTLIPGEYGRQ